MSWVLPPMFVRVQISKGPALWLPIVVLWPVLIALFVVGLGAVPVLAATMRMRWQDALAALFAVYRLLNALHGTVLSLDDGAAGHGSKSWQLSVY